MSNKIIHKINYIKADGFSTHLGSGVIGGITVNGLINMNVFTDRNVIPQESVIELDDNRVVKPETTTITKEGSVRELCGGYLFDIHTAKLVRDWLDTKIKELETLQVK